MIPALISKLTSLLSILALFGISKKEFWKIVIVSGILIFFIGSTFNSRIEARIESTKAETNQRMDERDSLLKEKMIQNQQEIIRRFDHLDKDIDKANENIIDLYRNLGKRNSQ